MWNSSRNNNTDGPKLLASSFLSALSLQSVNLENTSKCLGTTEEWLKDGGKVEAKTKKLTISSGGYTTSQLFTNALLLQVTSPEK